ncbi:MAG: hypothetical protein HFJ49_03930 [Clostridia bacterium]|nr:hypothetical protein [Clostridia bacterium]
MYNNVYEDYIRNMIRGSDNPRNDYLNCGNNVYNSNLYENEIYGNNEFENSFINPQISSNLPYMNTNDEINLEECYPELYRLLYPMIQKVCMKCTRSVNRDIIDEMVEEVYSNFVGDEGESTQININLSNDVRSSRETSTNNLRSGKNELSNSNKSISSNNIKENKSNITSSKLDRSSDKKTEVRSEDRQSRQRNPILNDLIRILILRELLGRPGGNFRPPFGRPPQRPPRPSHNRPNNMPNFPNFPNRPNPGRPRDNRLSFNQTQQDIYSLYPNEMFEDGYNII